MSRYINSPFHCLSDTALNAIAQAVDYVRINEAGANNPLGIELSNFQVDITAELQHRQLSGTSYIIPRSAPDNSDLLG